MTLSPIGKDIAELNQSYREAESNINRILLIAGLTHQLDSNGGQ